MKETKTLADYMAKTDLHEQQFALQDARWTDLVGALGDLRDQVDVIHANMVNGYKQLASRINTVEKQVERIRNQLEAMPGIATQLVARHRGEQVLNEDLAKLTQRVKVLEMAVGENILNICGD